MRLVSALALGALPCSMAFVAPPAQVRPSQLFSRVETSSARGVARMRGQARLSPLSMAASDATTPNLFDFFGAVADIFQSGASGVRLHDPLSVQ